MGIRLATKKERKQFFKTIGTRARRKRNPFNIMFELSYRCNFKCPHCYLPGSQREGKELSANQVFTILEQLKDMGVYRIGFTGGEPLVREDIFDILGYANRCGFKFGLLSNGYLIDEKTIKRLKEVNVNKVGITFNSLRPEVFDKLTGLKGSFEKVKRAVELLKKEGLIVAITSTCMSINKDEIVEINRFARNLGIIYRIDAEMLPCKDGCTAQVDRYSISAEEYEDLRRKLHPEMFKGNRCRIRIRRRRDRVVNCDAGTTSFFINPYGRMNLCLEIDYPGCDILSEGVSACWERIKKEVDEINRAKDFVCKDCDLLEYCGWCIGRSYIESGNFNTCSEFFKERALERKRRREKHG